MPHLADGTLRRMIDEPSAVDESARTHLEECPPCNSRLRALSHRATSVAAALGRPAGPPPNLSAAQAAILARSAEPAPPRYRAGLWTALAVATAVLLFVVVAPLRTIAQNFLAIFEPRQIVALPLTRADMRSLHGLPNLSSFGIERPGLHPQMLHASDVATAETLARMPLLLPRTLPPNAGTPHFTIQTPTSETFTFSAAKARAAAAAQGRPLPPMPARLNGSTLFVSVGPIVVAVYGNTPRHVGRRHMRGESLPPLVIAQGPVPRISSTGASAREIENYLLSMPGISPQLAAEIRAIGDPATTLPIPIPVDRAYASHVTVQGLDGLAVGDETGLGAGVVWRRGTAIYAVAGTLPMREIMSVAESLR